MTFGQLLAWRIRRRLPPMARLGWLIAAASLRRGSTGPAGVGLGMLLVGTVLGRSQRRELLTAFEMDPGEAATIVVRKV